MARRTGLKVPEYAHMQNGDLVIPDNQVLGNGGLDLTPLPQESLIAEESRELGAIDVTADPLITWQHS